MDDADVLIDGLRGHRRAPDSGAGSPFMTIQEVAAFTRSSPRTIRRWIEEGRLSAFRVGRRVLIDRSELVRVLESGAS